MYNQYFDCATLFVPESLTNQFGESMKSKTIFAILLFLFASTLLMSQAPAPAPRPSGPETPTVAPNIPGVVAAGTKVERVWTTTTDSSDGVILAPDGNLVLPTQGVNEIKKVDKDGKVTLWLKDTNEAGGIAFDTRGRVVAVERTIPRVRVLLPEPRRILVSEYEGQALQGAADIVADMKGGVYFTEGRQTPPGSAVYYISAQDKVTRLALYTTERANGITLSPDGRTLYVGNSASDILIAYDVQPDGSIQNRRDFGKLVNGRADGLAVDSTGRVYVATQVGIQVLTPQGQNLGTIPTPRNVTTLAFAGPDKKTLYFVGRGNDGPGGDGQLARSLYKVQMLAEGIKNRQK
jgi:gluconolactonase